MEDRIIKPDHIEYYYDKHSRLWIIQVIADDGCEYADGWYEYQEHVYHGSIKDSIIREWCTKYGIKAKKVL